MTHIFIEHLPDSGARDAVLHGTRKKTLHAHLQTYKRTIVRQIKLFRKQEDYRSKQTTHDYIVLLMRCAREIEEALAHHKSNLWN